MVEQGVLFDPDLWSGKTSSEHFPAENQKERTLQPSSRKSSKSSSRKPPMCLCLKKGGPYLDASMMKWETGAQLGAYTTPSFGERPKDGADCRLSQILEDAPPQKYCLSEKACRGILKRAAKRGKQLPPELKAALEERVIPSKSGGGVERDSAGKQAGKGALIQTELSGTLGVSQDQTLIETDKKAFGISSYESNAMRSPNPSSGFYEADTSRTLDNNGGNPACHQGGIAVCDAIPVEGNGYRPSHRGDGYGEKGDPSFTLNSTEHHAVAIGIDLQGGKNNANYAVEQSPTMMSDSHGTPHAVAVEQEGCDVYNGTISGDQAVTLTAAAGQTNTSGPKVLEKHSYGLDHVMLSGGTTYQGRGYYNELCGCLKTQAHGVAEIGKEDTDT